MNGQTPEVLQYTGVLQAPSSVYWRLSEVLEYPREDIHAQVAACINAIQVRYPGAMQDLRIFADYAVSVPVEALQEDYTATFDLKPFCSLDIGYHVFGESYKRGAFLAGMQRLVRETGLEPLTELPDHLTVVLKLLTVMPKDEEYTSLVELILAPALNRMCGEFKNSSNVYGHVLRVVDHILRIDHDITYVKMQDELAAVPDQSKDFMACGVPPGGCAAYGDYPATSCAPADRPDHF